MGRFSTGKQYHAPSGTGTHNTGTDKTGSTHSTGTSATDKKALEGSLDWYEQKMEELKKQIYASNDSGVAAGLQKQYTELEQKAKDLKVKIGLEKPEEKEVKSYIEELQDKLHDAQSKASDVQSLFDAGLLDKADAQQRINDINKELKKLGKGVKPIELKVDVEKDDIEKAREAIQNLGSSYGGSSQLGRVS